MIIATPVPIRFSSLRSLKTKKNYSTGEAKVTVPARRKLRINDIFVMVLSDVTFMPS
jgi:hypothetical protein